MRATSVPMPAASPGPPMGPRRVRLAHCLGILALVVAAAACSRQPSAPSDSGADDAALTAEADQEASNSQTAKQDDAAVGGGARRFDIDADTTMREVFDAFSVEERACIRRALGDDVLESVLDTPLLSDDQSTGPSVLSCLGPDDARELFLSVATATAVAEAGEEGLSARIGDDEEACMRDLIADVDVAALVSEPESDHLEEFDVSGLMGASDLTFGMFACIPDVFVASMGSLAPEHEWCVRGLLADVVAGDYRSVLASDPELDDLLESEPRLAGLGPLLGLTSDLFSCTPDILFDSDPDDPPPASGESDDHADVLDWATYAEVGEAVPGVIDHGGDVDFFTFWAEQGTIYEIDVALGTLPDSTATLYDDRSSELAYNDDYSDTTASRIAWQAEYTGEHFVAVESFDDSAGTYRLAVTSDIPYAVAFYDLLDAAAHAEIGEAVPGTIDHDGDVDFFTFWAVQGEHYQIDVALGTLADSIVTLYASDGSELEFNDDYGDTTASRIQWRADFSGDHYLAVESFASGTGTYSLTVASQTDVPAALSITPGEGVDVIAGRANWSTGYFQAELYKQLLEELGFNVSDPAELELGAINGYVAMAQGDMDYWPNSFYPAHLAWLAHQLPDGSLVGDHVSIVGEEMIAGGLQGFLITKSFADDYGVYTMDELNSNAKALAAFDATDPVPGNGIADIFGCPESWTCDNVITNQIAFSGWDNIQQTIADYDAMFAQAVDSANEGVPMVAYTWTPSAYITQLRPGDNVYWMGVDAILDDSNPANQEGGAAHSQRGADGSGGYAAIGPDQCPSAADNPDGLCPIGWIAADILITANNDFLAANPAAERLFEVVRLSVIDVSLAIVEQDEGAAPSDLATQWIADNRSLVDRWLAVARAAA